MTVSDLTAIDEPVGVFAHIGSHRRHAGAAGRHRRPARCRRSRRPPRTSSCRPRRSTARELAGVAIGGTAVELRDVAVTDSQTGVRIERGADDVTAIGLRLSGGRDGVVTTAGTARVVLHDLRAVGVENDAVRTFSPDTRILGGTIVGATTGVTAGAATTISRASDEPGQRRHPGPLHRPRPRRGGRHRRRRGRHRRRTSAARSCSPTRACARSRRCAAS